MLALKDNNSFSKKNKRTPSRDHTNIILSIFGYFYIPPPL